MIRFPSTLTPAQVREIRRARGLTAPQMAEKVGISPKFLNAIECGSEPISRLVENAIRFVELTGGPEIVAPCEACGGFGMVRACGAEKRGGYVAKLRCEVCDGQGLAPVAEPLAAAVDAR